MRDEVKDLYLIKLGTRQWARKITFENDRLMRAAVLRSALRNLNIRCVPWMAV